ncbi:uncharacterized protein LOC127279984 [Leptopilina boulardi]|uniref:uncharacterized protein LOC127279984 n=1 Tax=Leptopilina boulardi TaxID=63433 RepID=UPI0021F556B4|nr:uncharacterized protein LOC127279984 [Leptopilina boulardi]
MFAKNSKNLTPHRSCCVHLTGHIQQVSDLKFNSSLESSSSNFNNTKQTIPFLTPILKRVKKKCTIVIKTLNASYNHFQARRRSRKLINSSAKINGLWKNPSTILQYSSDDELSDEDESLSDEESFNSSITDTIQVFNDSNNNLISILPKNLLLNKFLTLLKRMETRDCSKLQQTDDNNKCFIKKYAKLTSFPVNNNNDLKIEKSEIKTEFSVVKYTNYPGKFNKILPNHRSGCVVTDNFEKKNKQTIDVNPFPNFDICKGFQFVSITRASDKIIEESASELNVIKPELIYVDASKVMNNYQSTKFHRNTKQTFNEDQQNHVINKTMENISS